MFEAAERYASGEWAPGDWEPLIEVLSSLPGVACAKIDLHDAPIASDQLKLPLSEPVGGTSHVVLLISEPERFAAFNRSVELALRTVSRASEASKQASLNAQLHENMMLAEVARWTNIAVLIVDTEFKTVWLNASFTKMLGFHLDDVRGLRPANFLYTEDIGAEVRNALSRHRRYHGELITMTKAGDPILMDVDVYPHYDIKGKLAGYVSLRTDLSERMRATEGIANSEARFRELVEISADWYWETDAADRYITLQGDWPRSNMGRMLRRPRLKMLAQSVEPEQLAAHAQIIRDRQPFRDFLFPIIGDHGDRVWISSSGRPYFDRDGRFLGYRGSGRNVTRDVEARATVDRMVRALDLIDTVVALFDADDRLIFANRRYRSWFDDLDIAESNPTHEELLRVMADLGLMADPAVEIPKRMAEFRSPEGPVEIYRNETWYLARQEWLPGGGCIVVATDIDARKRQEIELIEARDNAERANASKSSFLARMSHELRTPLNAILGLSDMILSFGDSLPAEKQHEYVEDIQGAGSILLSHIEDILDFARLDAGVQNMAPEAIDVRSAGASILRLMRPIAGKNGIRLRATMPRDLPAIHMDPRAFEQVMINLLSNAVSHSEPGRKILVSAVAYPETVALTVTDQGTGIPRAELSKVFEPFYQSGDAKLSRVSGTGTGLGLAIVKSLVEINHGKVSIQSTPGKGTSVTFEIPISEAYRD